MHLSTLFIVAATAAALSACSDSAPSAPLAKSFTLQFEMDSAQVYGLYDPCHTSPDMYCRAWQPTSGQLSGKLDQAGGSVTVTVDQLTYPSIDAATFHADSLPVGFSDIQRTCNQLSIRVKETGDEVHGTWTEVVDCHGRLRAGVVNGTLQ